MKMISIISQWWSDINLKTRLMVLATLVVSLIMSGLTFWALTVIQEDSITSDNRFCIDLGILFASNLLNFAEIDDTKELASFIEKIYLTTSSIRYILLFHIDGTLFFSLPVYSSKVQHLLQLHRNLFQLEIQDLLFGTPLVKANTIFQDSIIDVVIPLAKNGKIVGSLDIGINSNPTLFSSQLMRNISVATFVSIWLIFVVGAAFNALTITEPIKELMLGVKNISSGNFNQRIILPYEGELGNLIVGFNEMAEKLDSYEKKNIDKLILEKTKLETIVATIADGAILIDVDLRFLFVNQIAIKVFNWSNIDITGKFMFDYLPLHVTEALMPILNNWVKSNHLNYIDTKTQELCVSFSYDSGKIFRFLLTAVVDCNTNILTSIAIIIQDISREVKLSEAKHQFIANVSHELRTPLCNIGSFLETLLDYYNTLNNHQKIRFLNIAHSETKRLSILVNDILDLSQLESEYNYNLLRVDIVDIINNIVQSYQLIASYNNIRIIVEFDHRVKYVQAHSRSLLQVFANLLSNAIKFTSMNGQIVLRVYEVSNYTSMINISHVKRLVRIEIIDEGIGIDARDQKQVFDRFVRIENKVHALEGTGLGLSIVTGILTKHGTKIFLQSEPFVGTILWFDLMHNNEFYSQ